MGAEAKDYMKEHAIPQLFEGLMTGLIYNKPTNPIDFLVDSLTKVKKNPEMAVKWDTFVDGQLPFVKASTTASTSTPEEQEGKKAKKTKKEEDTPQSAGSAGADEDKKSSKTSTSPQGSARSRSSSNGEMVIKRKTSVSKAAAHAVINSHAPIILFMGGPGGGKTKHAAKVRDALESLGLVHICVPDLIKAAIHRYKDMYPEWREASEKYQRGELIANNLAQEIVKAEMGRFPKASAYFLEGFPREAKQVEDFEKNVRRVNMAMILDYDENTLRNHMMNRGLASDVIDRRINEFRSKTLPSAKYFDDNRLLHLIPGEKDDKLIFDRMKKLVSRAMDAGVPESFNEAAAITTGTSTPSEANGKAKSSSKSSTPGPSVPVATSPTTSSNGTPKAAIPKITPRAEINGTVRSNGVSRTSSVHQQSQPSTPKPQPSPHITPLALPEQTTSIQASPRSHQPDNASTSRPIASEEEPLIKEQRIKSRQSTSDKPPITPSKADSRPPTGNSTSSRPRTQDAAMSPNPSGNGSKPASATGTRPATGSRPATGARPVTGGSEQSKTNGTKPGTPAEGEDGAASSVASTPKPAEAGVPDLHATARLGSASTASRLPTAADRFPKGLPNNAPVILLIGAPGSNKAINAERIAKSHDGFVHISMGDLLRKKVRDNAGDELWDRIGNKLNTGELIPMKICREILYSTIHDMGTRSWGYVIEGYPRTLAQAEDLENQLGRLDVAILLDCSERYCKDNIKKRYEEGKEDGSARPDDADNPMNERLALFKQNTLPMLKHLDDKNKLRVLEGDAPFEEIYNKITAALQETVFSNENQAQTADDAADNSFLQKADSLVSN